MLKVFRRFVIISFVSAILTMAVFVSFNTPKVVKAEVISAVALGVGALAVLTASYFAVAGVQITNNGGSETYVEGWYNDIINRYKQADVEHQQMVDTYFNSNGEFIGTEDDLQFVLSDQAYGYWQMGKGVNSLMEDIKEWFVNTFSVNSSSPVVLSSSIGVTCYDGQFLPTMPNRSGDLRQYSLVDCNSVGDSCYYQVTETFAFGIAVQTVDSRNNFTLVINNNGAITSQNFYLGAGGFNYAEVSVPLTSLNYNQGFPNSSVVVLGLNADGSYRSYLNSLFSVPLSSLESSSISLDGALTDGYQDYQDALNQDLSNESENDDAVVQVGVGALPGVLTGEQVVADLLEQATANTLEGIYEGVYENQEEATEDKEGEKEFVPEVPPGWVVVNGLEDFFPFCIPFDFYNLVTFFDAEPEAPVFEFDIELGGVLGTHHIELDFSSFDLVARIFRVTVVIGFIVFLILATRSRFIRG